MKKTPNHKGLESAKPDLQSLFKKPGGLRNPFPRACARPLRWVTLFEPSFARWSERLRGDEGLSSDDSARGEIKAMLPAVARLVNGPTTPYAGVAPASVSGPAGAGLPRSGLLEPAMQRTHCAGR
jgi:hypothetical protein